MRYTIYHGRQRETLVLEPSTSPMHVHSVKGNPNVASYRTDLEHATKLLETWTEAAKVGYVTRVNGRKVKVRLLQSGKATM